MKNKMQKYADKYFLRANEILKKDGLNPWVNMQVFVRKGPGRVKGIDEAVELILENSNLANVGGRIYAKRDGKLYEPKKTLMNIIAPVQEIMELETVYLGVIAAGITRENGGNVDLKAIQKNVEQVVELAGDRGVLYFGARHWHWNMDKEISEAAFKGGVKACSTDNGAEVIGQKGVGTIPHALENIYAYKFGLENAVVKSTEAFDKYIDPAIPRIALVDYANREITDTLDTMKALGDKLYAVRVDTCGENIAEGGVKEDGRKSWTGKGVTVYGVAALRRAMNVLNKKTGIVLSSGFSKPEKVKAFNDGEKYFGMKLYDGIGAGFLDNIRTSTADVVAVGESPQGVDFYEPNGIIPESKLIHKVGRVPRPNKNLERLV